jgi:hypothetical protein
MAASVTPNAVKLTAASGRRDAPWTWLGGGIIVAGLVAAASKRKSR